MVAAEDYHEEEVRDGMRALNTESEQNPWYLAGPGIGRWVGFQ